jgi:hypothetical protein
MQWIKGGHAPARAARGGMANAPAQGAPRPGEQRHKQRAAVIIIIIEGG